MRITLLSAMVVVAGLSHGQTKSGTTLDQRQIRPSYGPDEIAAEQAMKRLVVKVEIRSDSAGNSRIAAGIIVGFDETKIYLATANHSVRKDKKPVGESAVQFSWSPRVWKAIIEPQFDIGADVAVLSVAGMDVAMKVDRTFLSFDRIRNAANVMRAEGSFTIGHPNGNLWYINVAPDLISSSDGQEIRFESDKVAPGSSGGALLDVQRMLIGMIRSDRPPIVEAVSIERVLELFRKWKLPVNLKHPTTTVPTEPKQPDYVNPTRVETAHEDLARARALQESGRLKVLSSIGANMRILDARKKSPSDIYTLLNVDRQSLVFRDIKTERLKEALESIGLVPLIGCCYLEIDGTMQGSGVSNQLASNKITYFRHDLESVANQVKGVLQPWFAVATEYVDPATLRYSNALVAAILGGLDIVINVDRASSQ